VENDAALARRLAPYAGRITAQMAAVLSGPTATISDRIRADALARQALRQDPTAVVAVSTLGLNAQVRGDVTTARRLFAYAEKLSRRNLPTQLWAIEDAVVREDLVEALHHYDIALRTSARAPETLFPILASANIDPEVRTALIRTLATKPLWTNAFLVYLAAEAPDPRSTATLFLGLRRIGIAIPENALTGAVNALVADGFADEAWSFYASIHDGVDRRRSRDPQFTVDHDPVSLLDWVTIDNGGTSGSIQRGNRGGVIFNVPASAGGPILQQVQILPPGTYRIVGRTSGIEQDPAVSPYWMLTCRKDGREFGRVMLPKSVAANGSFEGSFVVPADCPIQTLVLVARPSDSSSGLSGQIERAELVPAQ
jgi:hypothetical protein